MFCLICRHGLPRIVSPPTSASGSALSFPLVSPSFPARLRHSREGGNPAACVRPTFTGTPAPGQGNGNHPLRFGPR